MTNMQNSTTINTFVEYPAFLEPTLNRQLLENTLAHAPAFTQAQVVHKTTAYTDWRSASVLFNWDFNNFRQHLTQQIQEKYPEVCHQLNIEPFEIDYYEIQLTAHNDGDFYKVHTDSGNELTNTRIITFVYYFHSIPKKFQGGQLVIMENGQEEMIEPDNNKVVFFVASRKHRVNLVTCPDKAFSHSRFTLNGWIRKKVAPVH